MGLDTFPLLQNQTCLITYKNTVFKLKLEYQNVTQQMKDAFVQVVSEREAHCQIEDVCRALLYNIEREQPISAIQSEHFVIYPEVHKWPLAKKVQFFIHGKQLSCHQDLILLKLICKGDSVSDPDQNQVDVLSSNSNANARLSSDTSQVEATSEKSDKKNASTLCPGDTNTNNKKSSVEVVLGTKNNASVCNTPVVGISNIIGSMSPDNNHKVTLLQQHCSQVVSSDASGEQDSSHLETSHLEASFTAETVEDNVLSDKSTHEKSIELRGRKVENVSRGTKHLVNLLSTDNFKQSTQQAPKVVHSMLKNRKTVQAEKVSQREVLDSDSNIEHLDSSSLQADKGVRVSCFPESQPALYDELHTSNQHPVMYEGNNKVVEKKITRSELRKRRYVCKQLLHDSFRKSERKYVTSQIKREVTNSKPHQNTVKSLRTCTDNKSLTLPSKEKSTCGRSQFDNMYGTVKGVMKHKSTFDEMKPHSGLEISDNGVVEISDDGSTFYQSERIIDHEKVTPVSPIVTLRNRKRKQISSPKYSDTKQHQVCRYRSKSAERYRVRRLSGSSTNIVREKRQISRHDAMPAECASSNSSQISVHSRRIATKYKFSSECSSASQTKNKVSFKKTLISLEAKEQGIDDINKEIPQTMGKSHSYDSLKRATRSYSDSPLSKETDSTLRLTRRDLSYSPALSSYRGICVPDTLVEAQQHLLKAKDGVWLFWK